MNPDISATAAASGNDLPDYFGSVRTEVAEHLRPALGDVLEIGCGKGRTMQWIKQRAIVNRSTGVEIDPASGKVAREHFDLVDVCRVEDSNLLNEPQQFDTVLTLDVLEHLSNPAEQLQRIRRSMRPGGLLVASIPNTGNFSVSWPLFFRGQWRYTDEGHLDRTHLRFFDEHTAAALLVEAGFQITKTSHTVKCPNVFAIIGWEATAARWYSRRLFQWLAPRHMWVSQFIFSATPMPDPAPV